MRALNRKDAHDLLWLLFVLILMTNLLRLALQVLIQFDLPTTDAWLISCLLLLLFRRPAARLARRIIRAAPRNS